MAILKEKKTLANSLYPRLRYALRFSFKVHNGGASALWGFHSDRH